MKKNILEIDPGTRITDEVLAEDWECFWDSLVYDGGVGDRCHDVVGVVAEKGKGKDRAEQIVQFELLGLIWPHRRKRRGECRGKIYGIQMT